ncbi:hypothetical protein SPAP_0048 [Streptococcus phage PhiSpn_200]|nr:hypothetical protein SPAP_0048 [Streptococcus phage PhiSpn_200] [Streptococcus pneumoniae AP200]SBQ14091.1 hypothetical protein SP41844_2085 [Streptococcus pneumoniae]
MNLIYLYHAKNSESKSRYVLFLLEVSMRPKRYPYSLTSEILVETSIIYAWDKPMYKMISFMNRYTREIRVESFKL